MFAVEINHKVMHGWIGVVLLLDSFTSSPLGYIYKSIFLLCMFSFIFGITLEMKLAICNCLNAKIHSRYIHFILGGFELFTIRLFIRLLENSVMLGAKVFRHCINLILAIAHGCWMRDSHS